MSGSCGPLELLGKVGHPGPEEAIQAGGRGPDVRVVDGVTVNILVTNRAYTVAALQLVSELSSRPENIHLISFLYSPLYLPVKENWVKDGKQRLFNLPGLYS